MKAMNAAVVVKESGKLANEFHKSKIWVRQHGVESVSRDNTKKLIFEFNLYVYEVKGLRVIPTGYDVEKDKVYYKLEADPRATGWCHLDEFIYHNPNVVLEFEKWDIA